MGIIAYGFLPAILFPHQESGIKWLVYSYFSDYKGGILADQMGLGKTWTAAIAAHNICIAVEAKIRT